MTVKEIFVEDWIIVGQRLCQPYYKQNKLERDRHKERETDRQRKSERQRGREIDREKKESERGSVRKGEIGLEMKARTCADGRKEV